MMIRIKKTIKVEKNVEIILRMESAQKFKMRKKKVDEVWGGEQCRGKEIGGVEKGEEKNMRKVRKEEREDRE